MDGTTTGRRDRVVMLVVAICAVGVLLAALLWPSGEQQAVTPAPVGSPTPTATVSQTPSSSPSPSLEPPDLPEAAKEPTPDGAVAFVRYYLDLYNYTFATYDMKPIKAVSYSTCKFCASIVEDAGEYRDDGFVVEPGKITVSAIVASAGEPTDGLLVSAVLRQAPAQITDKSGKVTRSPGQSDTRLDFRVVWRGSTWKVRGARQADE